MPLYNFTIRLADNDLPYPDLLSAEVDCEEWAREVAQTEACTVVDWEVVESE